MTTEKLFYQDPYMKKFTATLVKIDKDAELRTFVVLDRTAFYPIGGGQPHDTGALNGVPVDIVEEVDGEIRHYIDGSLDDSTEISGEIDWERRLDHMQQHAGQHLLSAAFEDIMGYKTVSFHLGKEIASIDLETADLSDDQVKQVEVRVNEIILENRPIETKWVSKEEINRYPLRKELSVSENIRLVIIPDVDYNGCGGTHPSSTGEVSAIKILHWEKQKKNKLRVYFVCGLRVLKQLGNKHHVIQCLTDKLNAPEDGLTGAADRVLQSNKELEKTNNELKLKLIDYEAKTLGDQAILYHGYKVAKVIFQNRPMPELQQLAKSIVSNTVRTIALIVNENNSKLQLVCAKSEDVPQSMNELVKQTMPVINGKGGGKAEIAQGGGDKILLPEKLMEHVVNNLKLE